MVARSSVMSARRGCCWQTLRSRAASHRRSPPERCTPVCSRADDRGSTRVAPTGSFGLAFEECARDVIEKHLVFNREQLPAALGQMRFKRRLVHEQLVEAAIEPIFVDLPSSSCRRSARAVRRYQSSAICSSLDGSHSRAATSTAKSSPKRRAPCRRQQPLAQRRQAVPRTTLALSNVTEPLLAFDPDAFQTYWDRHMLVCRDQTNALAQECRSTGRPTPAPRRRALSSSSKTCYCC